jgi:tRNA threonylcarbamoyladenosine biosynthesis protein TsaE
MGFTFTLAELETTIQQFLPHLEKATVVAFHGQMGAGKTTFISALCKALGVKDAASSPTFSIINQYKTASDETIYHMDWYRLKDEEEALQAGVEDALYSGHLCLVEWPERAAGLLPDDTLHITLELANEGKRKLRFV